MPLIRVISVIPALTIILSRLFGDQQRFSLINFTKGPKIDKILLLKFSLSFEIAIHVYNGCYPIGLQDIITHFIALVFTEPTWFRFE